MLWLCIDTLTAANGCMCVHVSILNAKWHLYKYDGKADARVTSHLVDANVWYNNARRTLFVLTEMMNVIGTLELSPATAMPNLLQFYGRFGFINFIVFIYHCLLLNNFSVAFLTRSILIEFGRCCIVSTTSNCTIICSCHWNGNRVPMYLSRKIQYIQRWTPRQL